MSPVLSRGLAARLTTMLGECCCEITPHRIYANHLPSPYTMKIKSLKVVDGHQNTTAYSYKDETGSHASIKVEEYVHPTSKLTATTNNPPTEVNPNSTRPSTNSQPPRKPSKSGLASPTRPRSPSAPASAVPSSSSASSTPSSASPNARRAAPSARSPTRNGMRTRRRWRLTARRWRGAISPSATLGTARLRGSERLGRSSGMMGFLEAGGTRERESSVEDDDATAENFT